MAIIVLLAFILTPLVEIAVFIQVGGLIGLWPTLAIVVMTAIIGTWLLRWQGLATLARAQDSLAQQRFPVREVFDGLCLIFAGALLLTPGFVTDFVGFMLFVPWVRDWLRGLVWRYLRSSGRVTVAMGEDGVIDADYHEVDPDMDRRDDPPRRIGRR